MRHDFLNWIGCGFATVLTAMQTNEVFQLISIILTCIATLTTIAYNIYKWYKKATQDGKITPDEIKELVDVIDDAKDKIENLGDNNEHKSK